PGMGGVGVAGGDLPDRAAGPVQAADEKAVDPDQLAGAGGLHPWLGLGLPRRLVGGPVPGDERKPLCPRREPVATQHPPDPVRGGLEPALALQLGGEAPWAKAWVGDREGEDPLLDDAG